MKTHGYDITQARLHRKTLCYSRVRGNAETLDQIVATLPQVLGCADSSMIHGIIQQRLGIVLIVVTTAITVNC